MRILCGIILVAAMALAANGVEVVSFKNAAKIKTGESWGQTPFDAVIYERFRDVL